MALLLEELHPGKGAARGRDWIETVKMVARWEFGLKPFRSPVNARTSTTHWRVSISLSQVEESSFRLFLLETIWGWAWDGHGLFRDFFRGSQVDWKNLMVFLWLPFGFPLVSLCRESSSGILLWKLSKHPGGNGELLKRVIRMLG